MNYVIGVEKINNVYCALALHSRCVLECLLVNVLECWSKFAGKELKSVPALLFINISLTGYSNGCFMCVNMRQAFFTFSFVFSFTGERQTPTRCLSGDASRCWGWCYGFPCSDFPIMQISYMYRVRHSVEGTLIFIKENMWYKRFLVLCVLCRKSCMQRVCPY